MTWEFDDIEALAAEYVLGTLDQAERRRAERLMAQDPAFDSLVQDWTRRLTPLTEAIPPEPPPTEVWQRIQAILRQRGEAYLEPSAPAVAARPSRPRITERLSFWRWCTLGASALAATLAAFIAFRPAAPPVELESRYVAVLNRGAAEPAWLVTVDLARKALTIRPLAEVRVAEQSLELWLVAGGEAKPRSLGLLSPEQEISLSLSAAWQEPEAAVLAISLEPPGGSPTGLPTGPVVYQGKLLPIAE